MAKKQPTLAIADKRDKNKEEFEKLKKNLGCEMGESGASADHMENFR